MVRTLRWSPAGGLGGELCLGSGSSGGGKGLVCHRSQRTTFESAEEQAEGHVSLKVFLQREHPFSLACGFFARRQLSQKRRYCVILWVGNIWPLEI